MAGEVFRANPVKGLIAADLGIGVDRREIDEIADIVTGDVIPGGDDVGGANLAFGDRLEEEDVRAIAAAQRVLAGAAIENVIAAAAPENVVAGAADQLVHAVIALQSVGLGRAADIFAHVLRVNVKAACRDEIAGLVAGFE